MLKSSMEYRIQVLRLLTNALRWTCFANWLLQEPYCIISIVTTLTFKRLTKQPLQGVNKVHAKREPTASVLVSHRGNKWKYRGSFHKLKLIPGFTNV